MRGSSIIRGEQIASHIGAKLNPTGGYDSNICIYVKPHIKPTDATNFKFKGIPYLDVVDGFALRHVLNLHPDITAIACSKIDGITLSQNIKNKVVVIPQHHCNFERVKKQTDQVITIGTIGSPDALSFIPSDLKHEIAKRNMKLIEFSRFFTRQEIIDFYKEIDVQLVWRSYMTLGHIKLSNPLKLVNSASFGIPTIALDEPTFKELDGCYLPVNSVAEFISQLDALRTSLSLYAEYSKKCLKKAEEYHIDNIGRLYKNLS